MKNELEFIADINKEVKKYGYTIVKIKPRCGTCKYLNGDASAIGIRCTNPSKQWRSDTARYKYKSALSCKNYEEDTVADFINLDKPLDLEMEGFKNAEETTDTGDES